MHKIANTYALRARDRRYQLYQRHYADKLSDIMTIANLDQGRLASLLGVNRSTISRWRSGHTLPDVAQWQLIQDIARKAQQRPQ